MMRNAFVLLSAAVVSVFSLGVGCSDSETTTTDGSGGSATTDGGGGSTSDGGSGGGTGGSGGAACLGCGEFLISMTNAMPSDVCGYQGETAMGLECDAGSDCENLNAFFGCACGPTCGAACGDNGCMGMPPTLDCTTCTDTNCATETEECFMD